MNLIIITLLLCTFSLFSMHHNQPTHTPQEIERIWYYQQMRSLFRWVDKKSLAPQTYFFYKQEQSQDTEVISRRGEILQR